MPHYLTDRERDISLLAMIAHWQFSRRTMEIQQTPCRTSEMFLSCLSPHAASHAARLSNLVKHSHHGKSFAAALTLTHGHMYLLCHTLPDRNTGYP